MFPVTKSFKTTLQRTGFSARFFSSTIVGLNQASQPKSPKETEKGKDKKTFKSRSTSRRSDSETLKTSIAYTQKIDGSNSASPVFEIDPLLYPRFESTQTYDPFDFSLTSVKMKLQASYNGPVNERSFGNIKDPLDLWKRPDILNEFVTSNGKIVQGVVVGNKGKTHKRISKAIRRSRAAGLMPYFHKSSLFQ